MKQKLRKALALLLVMMCFAAASAEGITWQEEIPEPGEAAVSNEALDVGEVVVEQQVELSAGEIDVTLGGANDAEPGTETPTEPGTETPTEPGTETPTEPGTETPTEPGTETPAEAEAREALARQLAGVLDAPLGRVGDAVSFRLPQASESLLSAPAWEAVPGISRADLALAGL